MYIYLYIYIYIHTYMYIYLYICYGTYLHGNGLFLLNIYRLYLTLGDITPRCLTVPEGHS